MNLDDHIDDLRKKIDSIDGKLLGLFEERMNVVSEIAAYKRTNNLPTLDREREIDKLRTLSENIKPQLEPYAQTLFETLFELSRNYQNKV